MKLKVLAITLCCATLIGCDSTPNTSTPAAKDISTTALQQTPGLEGCMLYLFSKEQYDRHPLNIVRCPGVSTTSVTEVIPNGKTSSERTVVTIDGKEYVPK